MSILMMNRHLLTEFLSQLYTYGQSEFLTCLRECYREQGSRGDDLLRFVHHRGEVNPGVERLVCAILL